MSGGSFVFTSTALRSLRVDEDLLERRMYSKGLSTPRLNSYLLQRAYPRPTRTTAHPPQVCRDLVVHNALFTGDLEAVRRLFPKGSSANLIVESRGGDMRWVSRNEGLWSLTYEQELTTPLHIAAGRGFSECLRHLLQRGADVELSPAGSTALHEACENGHAECVKLLLSYGASANAVSEDGLMPLHLCTSPESLECSKHLLQFGATVSGRSLEEDNTPLHVAAQHGLPGHTELYLRYGAALDWRNDRGNTPLNAACSQPQAVEDLGRYRDVCRMLLAAGADVHAGDQDNQMPLHMACKNVNPDAVDLLLSHGSAVNTMDYSGDAPMHNVLKAVAYKAAHQPERVVRMLLNHGSIRVWPGALPKVIKYCCNSPRAIEVLLNSYDRLKITDTWVESVPPDVFQKHKGFYESLFSLAQGPRTLQHLARCKIRLVLGAQVPSAVPKLGLPTFLQNYLLLDFRDYVH